MKFTNNDALFAWMQEEYLSEITLDAVQPPPKKTGTPPDEVTFTWSLHGTGNGDVVPYLVHAKGVRKWTVDGKRGAQAIGMRDADGPVESKGKAAEKKAGKNKDAKEKAEKKKAKGVHVVMDTPAPVELACASLEVRRGKVKKGALALIPFTDYANFVVEAAQRAITVGELLDAFGAPADAQVTSPSPSPSPSRATRITSAHTLGQITIVVRGAPWIHAHNFNSTNPHGYELSVSRKGASDDEWHRALEMPHRLGPARVTSTNGFWDDDIRWMAAIGKPVAARAKAKANKAAPKRDASLGAFGLFVVEIPRAVTLAEVLEAVGMPASATNEAHGLVDAQGRISSVGQITIWDGEWMWARIWCSAAQQKGNVQRMSFDRGRTTDEEWRRALELPRILGATFVQAGKRKGNLAKWMKALAAEAAPASL